MPENIITIGAKLEIEDKNTPGTFILVSNTINLGGPTGSATVIDATTLADNFRQKRLGIKDEGQVNVELFMDPTPDIGQQLMNDARDAGTLEKFHMTFTDIEASNDIELEFDAFVMTWERGATLDDLLRINSTLEITGQVTETFTPTP